MLTAFPLKERFHERDYMLCYTYIAWLIDIIVIVIVKAYFKIKI